MRLTSASSRARVNGDSVIMVGPCPPPVHGAAVAFAAVQSLVKASGAKIHHFNVAPHPSARGMRYHADRARRYLSAIYKILRTESLVYLSLSGGLGQLYDIILAGISRFLGRRIFIHHHSYAYINRRSLLFRALLVSAGKHVSHITLCECMRSSLLEMYRIEQPIYVVPNTFCIDIPPTAHTRTRLHNVGFLSNLTSEKGIDVFLGAMSILIAEGMDINAYIAGPANDDRILHQLDQLTRSTSRINWLGPIYGNDKASFLSSLDAFVFPTRYRNEAQPLVLCEAAAFGVPIVASDRGCIGDLVRSTGGTLLPPDVTASQLADELRAWATSATEFKARALAASQYRAGMHSSATRSAQLIVQLLSANEPVETTDLLEARTQN